MKSLKPEEIAVIICDFCGHVHAIHTTYGCLVVTLNGGKRTLCDCPGFLHTNITHQKV